MRSVQPPETATSAEPACCFLLSTAAKLPIPVSSLQSDTICYVLYCSDFIEIAENRAAKRFEECIPELPPELDATPACELERTHSW
jgi:hypothetical protein